MTQNGFEAEWQVLQNQYDQYEKYSLLIKLFSIAVLVAGYLNESTCVTLFIVLAVLWLQDAIWKTFQARTETRLLAVEQALAVEETETKPFQFNTEFANNRPGTSGLINEYIASALKPTVAYPHLVLLVLCLFC